MRRLATSLALASLLAACASAQKAGDQAAATGDWKTAEANYAQVLRDDPTDPEKQARWRHAREEAIRAALAHARACQVSQDWECAFAEADYLVRMEPGSAEHAALRAEAGRQAGWLRLRGAAEAAERDDGRAALDLLAQARAASADAGLQAEAQRLQPSVVAAAVRRAQQLRAQQQYPPALELLSAAAALDAGVRPALDQVRAERDRWVEARYEAQAGQGDALLRERRFGEAAQAYEAALAIRKGGRAEPLARYARALQHGDAAVARHDWPAASRAYDEAVRTGMDGTNGPARAQLDRVQVRTWAVRVRSALVRPIQPDGSPWAGHAGPGYQRLVGLLANAAMDGRGRLAVAGMDVYDALPRENRPTLVATVTLPDGRRFTTPPQTALRARFDAWVVVATAALDDRPIAVRVAHAGPQGQVEVGAVTVRVADLVAGGDLVLADRSVVELRLAAERSPLADGTVQGLAPVRPPPGLAAGPASAAPPPRGGR